MLHWLFYQVLFLSLAGGGAALLVLAAERTAGGLSSWRWRYYLWLLPLALFLVPVANVDLIARLPKSSAVVESTGAYPLTPAGSEPLAPRDTSTGTAPTTGKAETNQVEVHSEPTAEPPAGAGPDLSAVLPTLWLAGVCIFAARDVWSGLRFRRFRRRDAVEAEGWERALLDGLRLRLGVKAPVRLLRYPGSGSPFLAGMVHPQIFLPETALGPEELEPVLLHELTHCKRCDLMLKHLARAVRVLHWFNPLAWLAEREMGRLCELSCDERVALGWDAERRKAYGLTILKLMRGTPCLCPASACLAEREIKHRLEVILNMKTPTRVQRVLALALAAVLTLGCAAYAAGANEANPVKAQPGTARTEEFYNLAYGEPNEETFFAYAASGEAVVTDTFFQKSFSAAIHVDALYKNDLRATREDMGPATDFTVELTALTNVIQSYGEWTGTFTVKKDGVTVFDNEPGRLRYLPTMDGTRLMELLIGHDTGPFFSVLLNFGLSGTDHAAGRATDMAGFNALLDHPDTAAVKLKQSGDAVLGDYTVRPYFQNIIYLNDTLSTAAIDHFYLQTEGVEDRWLWNKESDVTTLKLRTEDVTEYDGNTLKGRFYLVFPNEQDIEFDGTITGLKGAPGETVLLASNDGAYRIPFTITDDWTGASLTPPSGPTNLQWMSEENKAEFMFAETGDSKSRDDVNWSELPFEVTVDGRAMTFRYTGDPQYTAGVTIRYTTLTDRGFQGTPGIQTLVGAEPVTIELPKDGAGCFDVDLIRARTAPYADMDRYTLSVSCGDEQAMITDMNLYHRENKHYSGEAAEYALKQGWVPKFLFE